MEPNILKQLADNPSLLQAVKELLIKQFSVDSLTRDQSDEVLGQMVRARLVGVKAIEDAMREIALYGSKKEGVDNVNPAY